MGRTGKALWFAIASVVAIAGTAFLRSSPLPPEAQRANEAGGRTQSLPAPVNAARHAIVVSVDGLMPASYTDADAHGLKIPSLRGLLAAGAWSPGVRDVLPAVTYPAHTTMATGVSPRAHGIVSNLVFDPTGTRDGEWYWYETEIRVPTIWQLAPARGLRTALIGWPATLGARGDAVVPEFWRGRGIDGAKLLRAISTPGLLDEVARSFPEFEAGLETQPAKDESLADIAVEVIERQRPDLLLLHIAQVDHWQHEKGPWSPEALAAIENADAQIGRVMAAARRTGIWGSTLFLVVSDHGFTRQEKVVRPGVLLRERGLITADDKNRVTSWRAQALTSGGSAYIYLHDPDDREAAARVRELFAGLAAQPGSGIRRLLSQDEIAGFGGDSQAFLAIEAADGFGFAGGITGDAIGPAPGPGLHGFPPDRESMNASLILSGPRVRPGKIEGARLVDIAPTVARWLELRMENVEGKPLAALTEPSAASHPK